MTEPLPWLVMTSRRQTWAAISASGFCVLVIAGCGRGHGELRPSGASPITQPSTIATTTTLIVVNESSTTLGTGGTSELGSVANELLGIDASLDVANSAIDELDKATPED